MDFIISTIGCGIPNRLNALHKLFGEIESNALDQSNAKTARRASFRAYVRSMNLRAKNNASEVPLPFLNPNYDGQIRSSAPPCWKQFNKIMASIL